MYICIYVYCCPCIYVYVYACICVYMYTCIYVYLYICIYPSRLVIHIYIHFISICIYTYILPFLLSFCLYICIEATFCAAQEDGPTWRPRAPSRSASARTLKQPCSFWQGIHLGVWFVVLGCVGLLLFVLPRLFIFCGMTLVSLEDDRRTHRCQTALGKAGGASTCRLRISSAACAGLLSS